MGVAGGAAGRDMRAKCSHRHTWRDHRGRAREREGTREKAEGEKTEGREKREERIERGAEKRRLKEDRKHLDERAWMSIYRIRTFGAGGGGGGGGGGFFRPQAKHPDGPSALQPVGT